jgi:hypothetical protein
VIRCVDSPNLSLLLSQWPDVAELIHEIRDYLVLSSTSSLRSGPSPPVMAPATAAEFSHLFDAPFSLDELSLVETTTTTSQNFPPRPSDISPSELMSSVLVCHDEPITTQLQAIDGLPNIMYLDGCPEVTQTEWSGIYGSMIPENESGMLFDRDGTVGYNTIHGFTGY